MALSRIQRGMIAQGAVEVPGNLFTTGTASATTFLRGDGAFANNLDLITVDTRATIRQISITTSTAGLGIAMNNTDIRQVNALYFADPGSQEGINWFGGNWWKVFDSPNDLVTNSTGNLQFVSSGTRILTMDVSGRIDIPGNLQITGLTTATNLLSTHLTATNLTSAGTVRFPNIADSTSSYILYYTPGTGNVTYSSGGSGGTNPFDQSLNTTDSPQFVGLTATGVVNIASTVTVTAGLGFRVTGLRSSSNAQEVFYNTSTGELTYVAAPGQSFYTTSSPTFANLTLTGNLGASAVRATTVTATTVVAYTANTGFTGSGFDTLRVGELIIEQDSGGGAVTGKLNDILLPTRSQIAATATLGRVLKINSETPRNMVFDDVISTSTASTFIVVPGFRGSELWPESKPTTDPVVKIQGSILPSRAAGQNVPNIGGAETGTTRYGTVYADVGNFTDLRIAGTITGTIAVSTSQVTGLSTVGWSNNYNDLTNRFLISTVTNQALFTSSGVTLLAGTFTQSVSAGGLPLTSSGTALIAQSNTQSVALVVSNFTAGIRNQINVRGYGQNLPNGTSTTPAPGTIVLEGSRGTGTVPTATGSGDGLGVINFSGYDGSNWLSSQTSGNNASNLPPAQIFVLAAEAFSSSTSITTNAGTTMFMRVQPVGTQLNTTSRRIFMGQSWTAGTTASGAVTVGSPPQLNIGIGQGSSDASIVTLTPSSSVGVFGTGSGRTNLSFNGCVANFFGVPSQNASGADNATLTGTNTINFFTGRRNWFSGRRDALISGDTVFAIAGYSQTTTGSTGIGSQVTTIAASMLEAAGAGARGSQLIFQTVNTGTTTLATRQVLRDQDSQYYSDTHVFREKSGTFTVASLNTASVRLVSANTVNAIEISTTTNFYANDSHNFNDRLNRTALTLTTSTAAFGANVAITTYRRAFGEFLNTATITPAAADTAYIVPVDTVTTSSNVSISGTGTVTLNQAGIYNIQFSIQLANSDNAADHLFDIWFRKNGIDLPNSNTEFTIIKNNGKNVAALNLVESFAASDNFELVYAVDNTAVHIDGIPAQSSPYVRPATPSVILTVVPVGA